jgi:Tfp pilus assembly protein PilX
MRHTLHKSENGIVSIIVTMILMIVITIIVLGFAQNARRELRSQLDRQLSTQAFYAAESGVNDAQKAIRDVTFSGSKTNCLPDGSSFFPANSNKIDGTDVMYTCLLIDSSPDSLNYGRVSSKKATTSEIKSNGGNMATMTINWKCTKDIAADPDCVPDTGFNGKFPPGANWKQGGNDILGVLRTSITDLSGGFSRASLNANTITSFLYPHNGAGTPNWPSGPVNQASQGEIINGACAGTECTVTISMNGRNHIYLNLVSIYKDSDVTITAHDSGGGLLRLSGAQVKVDATGKAVDVLRRIQVRIPISPPAAVPAPIYAVQSVNGICKTLEVAPGNDPGSDPPLPHATQASLDPACDLP